MPTVFEQQDRAIDGFVASDNRIRDTEAPTNSKALLIENMQLVEPVKIGRVPNHLLETKRFSKVGQNDLVHARPTVLYFEGFEIGEKQSKHLLLLNASSDVLKMHIIPPQTGHFCINYTKPVKMVSGMTLDCIVEFTPDEWRYYYDCIRIHCPGEDNLVIPIHGYPAINMQDFPRKFTFKPVPVGHRISKTFPLRSISPLDFEFSFNYIQPHPAFNIEPVSGIVPANGETEVTIIFAPLEFQTAIMKVELNISQFNSKAIVCTFIGSSQSGMLKAKTLTSLESEVLDPDTVKPLDRARTNKKRYKPVKDGTSSTPAQPLFFERDGIYFPAVINSPYAVGKVLMQKPGKLGIKELKQNILAKKISKESTKEMKEAVFESVVRQNVYEEKLNQLMWQIKIGADPLSVQERCDILEERYAALDHYKYKVRGNPIQEVELIRSNTKCSYRKTIRNVDQLAPEKAKFDIYSNDLWAVRHAALDRFVQAARTIIINNLLGKKLQRLKSFIADWQSEKYAGTVPVDIKDIIEDYQKRETLPYLPGFRAEKVQKHKFPTYINPDVKDDMAPDALGEVPVSPVEVVVKRDIPFLKLKVPQFYKLQEYKPYKVKSVSSASVPAAKFKRSLRTGAEEELIKFSSDQPDPCLTQKSEDAGVGPRSKTACKKDEAVTISIQRQPVSLTPPDALFKSIEYPKLHIMNPIPGLQVFQAPMSYAEVDYDYHLCSLPRYLYPDQTQNRYTATQKQFLDREDTIRGIMSWKKFPSQSLTSLSSLPTLSNVWVPRWDGPFSEELLPEEVPPLLNQLDPEDVENCVEEHRINEEEDTVTLRPDMVTAQFLLFDPNQPKSNQKTSTDVEGEAETEESARGIFPFGNKLPNTNIAVGAYGPIARETREVELEYFMTQKYNRLGARLKAKAAEMDAMITDPDLVLN